MSKPRSSLYALSVAVLLYIAYRTKMAPAEVSLLENIIAHGFAAATALLATVKTWPWSRKRKQVDE